MVPIEKAIAEAKRTLNGYVYKIPDHYGPNDAVPPYDIVGEFIPNPGYIDPGGPLA